MNTLLQSSPDWSNATCVKDNGVTYTNQAQLKSICQAESLTPLIMARRANFAFRSESAGQGAI